MNTDNKRTTKEYPLPKKDGINIRTKYGTLDKNNPEILYIRSKATITPSIAKKDFSEEIALLKKTFEKEVKSVIYETECFDNKHICTIEMSENGIAYGKKSHLKYDVYLKPICNKQLEEYSEEIGILARQFNNRLTELLQENNIVVL